MPRLLAIAAGAVILVAMTGCIQPKPPATPTPTASAAPVFASEEEALAAAEESYAAYLAVSDAIAADGGLNPERLDAFVVPERLDQYLEEFQALRESKKHMTGTSTFDTVSLQRFDDGEVAVYLCLDVSGVRILDESGTDVTPADRPQRLPLEVTFAVAEKVVLQSSDVWEGGDYCAG